MTKTIKRYSEAFKMEVVAEYEAGANVFSLQKKYGGIVKRQQQLKVE